MVLLLGRQCVRRGKGWSPRDARRVPPISNRPFSGRSRKLLRLTPAYLIGALKQPCRRLLLVITQRQTPRGDADIIGRSPFIGGRNYRQTLYRVLCAVSPASDDQVCALRAYHQGEQ